VHAYTSPVARPNFQVGQSKFLGGQKIIFLYIFLIFLGGQRLGLEGTISPPSPPVATGLAYINIIWLNDFSSSIVTKDTLLS